MSTPTPMRLTILSDYIGGGTAATAGAGKSAARILSLLSGAGMVKRSISCFGGPPPEQVDVERVYLSVDDLRESVKSSPVKYGQALWNSETRLAVEHVLSNLDPDIDVVCLHQWTRSLSPSSVSLLSKIRHIVFVHDYFWMCPNGAYFNFQKKGPCVLRPGGIGCLTSSCDRLGYTQKLFRVARHYIKALSSGCEPDKRIFIHISEQSRNVVKRFLPHHRHYVLNHALDQLPEPPSLIEPAYDVGYFGRFEAEKGVIELAKSCQKLGLRGLFVGNGGLAQELALVPNATVVKWAEPDEVRRLMRSCRAVSLPSLWPETWGLIVPEALSAGVPVLVSDRAGSSELVERFGGGLIFSHDVDGDLDRALSEIVDEGRWNKLRAETNLVPVLAGLGPEHYALKFAKIINEAWGKPLLANAH